MTLASFLCVSECPVRVFIKGDPSSLGPAVVVRKGFMGFSEAFASQEVVGATPNAGCIDVTIKLEEE